VIAVLAALLLILGGPWSALAGTTAPTLVTSWDFESDDGGFTSGGDLPQWQWGEPQVGPASAHSGNYVWGTALDDLYLRENENTLTLTALDLSAVDQPVLIIQSWLDLASGDSAHIELDDGTGFALATPVYGYDGIDSLVSSDDTWTPLYIDLGGLTDLSAVRLVLASAASRAYGWYIDDVELWSGDAVPPQVSQVDTVAEWTRFDQGPSITATIQDNRSLSGADLAWSLDPSTEGGTTDLSSGVASFTALGGGRFQTTLPAIPPGTLTWTIQADDGINSVIWPDKLGQQTTVYLPPPTTLLGPDSHWWGSTVPLSWTAPDSDETVVGYRVYRDDSMVAETTDTSIDAPAVGPTDSFSVTTLFDTSLGQLEGRAVGPVLVDVAVPALDSVDPLFAYQGDLVRVTVAGTSLLMDANTLQADALSLGSGILAEAVDVEHVDRAIFTVLVDPTAPIGTRDAVLSLDDQQVILEDAFSVQSGDDRPAVLSVAPSAEVQGATDTLTITLSTPPDGLPTLDLGQGIVVEDVSVDGSLITADIAVANDAALGARTVTVDDGLRILELTDGFTVRAWSQQINSTCACGVISGRGASGSRTLCWTLALGVLVLGRRRPPA